jgi:hypothetical protein
MSMYIGNIRWRRKKKGKEELFEGIVKNTD